MLSWPECQIDASDLSTCIQEPEKRSTPRRRQTPDVTNDKMYGTKRDRYYSEKKEQDTENIRLFCLTLWSQLYCRRSIRRARVFVYLYTLFLTWINK